jgi:Uncharacterized protein conserved in archaea
MPKIEISENSGAEELAPIAIAINEILNLPVTMRSAGARGVRVERGKVVDDDYTGPVLEDVLRSGRAMRTIPSSGAFKGFRYQSRRSGSKIVFSLPSAWSMSLAQSISPRSSEHTWMS